MKKVSRKALSEKLKGIDTGIKALIGFDGFVDEVVHVVDKRIGIEDYIRLDSMAEYGKRIAKSAGFSTNIEMVTVRQKLGGNGPIFADSLISYGAQLTYIGALGLPDIHPVFKEMVSKCRAISIADPARTDAIEFFDGKIISSKLEAFKDVNWQSIEEKVGAGRFAELIEQCDLVGFNNWTMVYYMSEIFGHIVDDVLPRLKGRRPKPIAFFDLADPEKREKTEILRALELIGRFGGYFTVVLGLNKKEACEIAQLLGLDIQSYDEQELRPLAEYIYSKLSVDILAVHPLKEACAVSKDGYFCVPGPYTEKPKLTTGAGDNFNSGFVLGVATGLGLGESLLLGTSTSGFYVRHMRPPELHEMIKFLNDWADDII